MCTTLRLQRSVLCASGLVISGYGTLSSLSLLKTVLGPLAADGHVGRLSGGETVLLRLLAVLAGLALGTAAVFLPAIETWIGQARRLPAKMMAQLRPQACRKALSALRRRRGSAYTLTLVMLFVVGIAVRFAHLRQPMHDDECGAFLNWSAQPIYVSVTKYGAPGNHVLHTALVAVSTRLFGDSSPAIRLPALLAGICLLPAASLLVLRVFGAWPALIVLAMIAASDASVEYAANARGYSLSALFGVWQTHALLVAMQSRRWRPWLFAAGLSALSIYVLPTMVYMLIALWVFALVVWWQQRRADRTWLWRVLVYGALSVGLASVLYSPFALVGGIGALTDVPFYAPLPLDAWLRKASTTAYLTADMMTRGIMPIAVFVPLAAIGFASLRRIDRRWPVLWAALFLTPVVVAFAQRVVPMSRTFIYLHPFAYGLAGMGLWELCRFFTGLRIRRRHLRVAPAIVVCLFLLVSTGSKFSVARQGLVDPIEFPQAEFIARHIHANFSKDVPVFVADPCARPLAHHLLRIEGDGRLVGPDVPDAPRALWARNAGAYATASYSNLVGALYRRFRTGPALVRQDLAELLPLTRRDASGWDHTDDPGTGKETPE